MSEVAVLILVFAYAVVVADHLDQTRATVPPTESSSTR